MDVTWKDEWYYGWDDEDIRIFGQIGYTEPSTLQLRRYFTGSEPYANHTSVLAHTVTGHTFRATYNWGFWDILTWNDIYTPDGVQSLNFDEQSSLDSVTAYTNQSMFHTRYNAPERTPSIGPRSCSPPTSRPLRSIATSGDSNTTPFAMCMSRNSIWSWNPSPIFI